MHAYRVCAGRRRRTLRWRVAAVRAGGQPAGAQPAAAPEAATGPEPGATGDLRCPAPVREGLPGPDIIGLRLGMTADEALATARCALGTDAEVSTANRWLDRLDTHGVELGTQTFTVRKGEHRPCDFRREWQECEGGLKWLHVDEVVTVTPGAPGRDRPPHPPRAALPRRRHAAGRRCSMRWSPSTASRNGPRNRTSRAGIRPGTAGPSGCATMRAIRWQRPTRCSTAAAVNAHPNATGPSGPTGATSIQAWIALSGRNPALAMEVGTAMLHQGSLYAHVEAMQDELRRLGQARREAEVQAAEARDVRL